MLMVRFLKSIQIIGKFGITFSNEKLLANNIHCIIHETGQPKLKHIGGIKLLVFKSMFLLYMMAAVFGYVIKAL